MKFIVSSQAMRKLLKSLDTDIAYKDEEYSVYIGNGYIKIHTSELLYIDHKSIIIETCNVSVKQLRNFSRICGILEDQPLMVEIKEKNNYITFTAVI